MNIYNNNLRISAHNIDVTPSLELTIKQIANELLKFNHVIDIHVTLKVDTVHPHLQHAEAKVCLSGKKKAIFAKASEADLYHSIHKLKDKLHTQIVKHKEVQHHHTNHHHIHHNYDFNNNNARIDEENNT